MKALVLHIGHSKCASSTLQAFLCANLAEPIVDVSGGTYRYAAIDKNGDVLHGSSLKIASTNSHFKYVASDLDIRDTEKFSTGLNNVKKLSGKNDTVVLSNEGWGNNNFVTQNIIETLNKFDVPIFVFLLTRPPVDWFNASWWQWGCWTGGGLEDWFKNHQNINFMKSLQQWKKIATVKLVRVADISQDPINSFLSFLGVKDENFDKKISGNLATDAELLRHLIRNKEYYERNIHTPQNEFKLNSVLQLETLRPPSVVTQRMAKAIIQNSLIDHKALLDEMAWCEVPLSKNVADRYISETAYDQVADLDFDQFLSSDYSDEFVFKLISRSVNLYNSLNDILAFDSKKYLDLNQDVQKAGVNPYEHFIQYGVKEGRKYK